MEVKRPNGMSEKELAFCFMGIASEYPAQKRGAKEEKSFDKLIEEARREIDKARVVLFVSALVCFVLGLLIGHAIP